MHKQLLPFLSLFFLMACSTDGNNISITNSPLADTVDPPITIEADEPEAEYSMKTISLTASDGLEITADWHSKGDQPVMLLCHQAGWSRGEYINTAKVLVEKGYNCLALDQRSGGEVNGISNETAKRAATQGLGTSYIDALPDLMAGLDYAYKQSKQEAVIIVGSSYSSALVLKVAGNNPKVKAVLSFSPGEYYKGESVAEWASKCQVPVFVTSSKDEASDTGLLAIIDAISGESTHFIPEGSGYHGARALFSDNAGNEEYWKAVNSFLDQLK